MTITQPPVTSAPREPGLIPLLLDDGRPALLLTGMALLVSGAFAVFLSIRREFLPHDVAFLGMTAEQVCALADCRVVRFMFHDRVAFGGTLMAVAILYLWLAAVPLRHGAWWAWRAFVVSGLIGFGSFLSYLAYGYLDSWHGVATLALLPIFVVGLIRTRSLAIISAQGWLRSPDGLGAPTRVRLGRWGLLGTGAGMTLAGAVILFLGSTEVFVQEDLAFMDVTREMLDAVNPRLVPLIAHDRAGFGGGLFTCGLLVVICAWFATPSRSFHQAIVLAGVSGFGCAIGIHFVEGYTNPVHLAPAFAGAGMFAVSVICLCLGGEQAMTQAAEAFVPSRPAETAPPPRSPAAR